MEKFEFWISVASKNKQENIIEEKKKRQNNGCDEHPVQCERLLLHGGGL